MTMKVTDMSMDTSSSEDMNASAHDVIGSGHGAEQEKMTLSWQSFRIFHICVQRRYMNYCCLFRINKVGDPVNISKKGNAEDI